MPVDAEFKGNADVFVQDILAQTDNILFHQEKYYATSTRKPKILEFLQYFGICLSKGELSDLLVLQHLELSLHNNPAELGARQRVRKREVSFGPHTQDGGRTRDVFMTLAETTRRHPHPTGEGAGGQVL